LVRVDRATGALRSREYHLSVVSGPDAGTAAMLEGPLVVGTQGALRLTDEAISAQHVELFPLADGVRLRDLGSTNGTFIGGARITEALLAEEATFMIGRTLIRIAIFDQSLGVADGPVRLGAAIGGSASMRRLFGMIAKVAPSQSPVVLLGETGTGKEVLARTIHERSSRKAGPFVVFDCAAVSPNLIESELFGHVQGAFTGASASRKGAFLEANGGTLFLDELGELALDLQPKLLRALEEGMVKHVGDETYLRTDVRIIAATHRDLEAEVRDGRFRQDLFFRLCVVPLLVPPLRERLEDLPALAQHFAQGLTGQDVPLSPALLNRLCAYHWPGNVRELRNVIARALIDEALALSPLRRPPDREKAEVTVSLPFKAAKERLVESFTRDYLEAMLARHGGNITHAAKGAGIARAHLHKLVEKYGLKGD
jgi:two-component system response regulator GlrR